MRVIASILILIFISIQPCSASLSKGDDPFPDAAASYLILVNGKTLWAHEPDRKLPIASITKIMTTLIVLEHCKPDEIVTIGKNVEKETGTRLGLKTGQKLKVSDLLSAVLIKSACDACVALAEHVGGDEERFVEMMNKRASELGLSNTHFQNAAGHDHENNYSTAKDIIVLTLKALKSPFFASTVSTASKKISTIDGKCTFQLKTTNNLIGRFAGVKGIKTGFTSNAGKCLVTLAGRNGTNVLLVLLNAPERWWVADKMLADAFAATAPKEAKR
jgi:serine-type D-Ala-D-Ala carboxypeptidase (penicillin-binding protein 5/6)